MEKLLFTTLVGLALSASAQGTMLWNNTSQTLISYEGTALPVQSSPLTTFYFGLFVAPAGTPPPSSWWEGRNDPNWQYAVSYTVNSTAAAGAGRLQNPGVATVPGYPPGTTINFIVRVWQSTTGGADWPAALPGLYNYGQSGMGTVILGGGVLPTPSAFGVSVVPDYRQISGFGFPLVPEPGSAVLVGIGFLLLTYRCRTPVTRRGY